MVSTHGDLRRRKISAATGGPGPAKAKAVKPTSCGPMTALARAVFGLEALSSITTASGKFLWPLITRLLKVGYLSRGMGW